MYKLLENDPLTGAQPSCVKRIADNSFIPFDPSNTDYQEYLRWIEAGNTPEPADEAAA